MDLTTVMTVAVPIASFVGAVMGQRVNVGWIKEKLAEHDRKHESHAKRLASHDLTLGLLENRR
ncbi:hypothetical protein QPM17_22720 [Marinobacter sp. TBZ242]|uniref:Uncharacterized protein n=1 Tax=Marinobacter azerbaijanicus TaxID=3050455 RepID=A0ABT7IIG1_9GAMM|nr:hypothetical protein [Marinobacter sp. TBZ242]MDL0433958.1 hypothetical protein [Marinobacter sp. TBZ242]